MSHRHPTTATPQPTITPTSTSHQQTQTTSQPLSTGTGLWSAGGGSTTNPARTIHSSATGQVMGTMEVVQTVLKEITGLEKSYDSSLGEEPGELLIERDAMGKEISKSL